MKKHINSRKSISRQGLATLEIMLAIALAFLILQLSANLRTWLFSLVDVTSWNRQTWFIANIIIFFALISIRFGPDLKRSLSQFFNRYISIKIKTAAVDPDTDLEYEQRKQRDAEWAARARNRLPYK